jgi:hypothetical protein
LSASALKARAAASLAEASCLLAARAASCRVFLLPYGYNEGRDVQELDCDAIVPDIVSAAGLIRHPGSERNA